VFSQIVDLYIYFGVNVFDSSFRSRENVLILNSFDGIDWFYLKSWFDRIFVSIIKSIPGARKLNPLRVSHAILKPERRRRSNPAARLRICPSKLDPEPGPVDYGLRTTDYGLRTTDYGLRTSTTDYGLRTSTTDYGLRTTDYGLRTTDYGQLNARSRSRCQFDSVTSGHLTRWHDNYVDDPVSVCPYYDSCPMLCQVVWCRPGGLVGR